MSEKTTKDGIANAQEFKIPEEMAVILKLDIQSIYRMLRSGELPGGKIRGQWRVATSVWDQFLADHNLAPLAESPRVILPI